jgi:dUTP pyrophosphatase
MKLNIQFVKTHPNAKMPEKTGSSKSVGFDLFACEYTKIEPFGVSLVNTGIKLAIPEGYYAEIRPRSGMAFKNKTDVFAGIIDNDFRGVMQVVLANFNVIDFLKWWINKITMFVMENPGTLEIKPGDKVAQLIFHEQIDADWTEVKNLDTTERNEKGFGSSGN